MPGRARMRLAAGHGVDPPPHRVAVTSSGAFGRPPCNGAVATLLAVRGPTHRQKSCDLVVVTGVVGALIALARVIVPGPLPGGS